MKRLFTLSTLLFCSALQTAWSGETLDFEDETTRINYSLGYQIGGDFKRQQVEMNTEAVVQGIRDAVAESEPKMTPEEIRDTLMALKRKVVAEQQARRQPRETELIAAGKKFLEENATKDGVIVTSSGLQYKVLREGAGASPGPEDQVSVHYRGTKIDGVEFDSSFKRGKPATFRVNSVIKGWSEGLQLMKEGGKMQLFIPPELAYKHSGPLEHKTLIFEVELLSVGEKAAATEPAAKAAE